MNRKRKEMGKERDLTGKRKLTNKGKERKLEKNVKGKEMGRRIGNSMMTLKIFDFYHVYMIKYIYHMRSNELKTRAFLLFPGSAPLPRASQRPTERLLVLIVQTRQQSPFVLH